MLKHRVGIGLFCLMAALAGCNSTSPSDGDTGGGDNNDNDQGGGDTTAPLPEPIYQPKANEAVIYYKRNDHLGEDGRVDKTAYQGWGLHLWEDDRVSVQGELSQPTSWDSPLSGSAVDENYGLVLVVSMNTDDWHDFMFIMHKGEEKDIGGRDWLYDRAEFGETIFLFEGVDQVYTKPVLEPPVEMSGASAHWLAEDTLAYEPGGDDHSVTLWHSSDASLELDGVEKSIAGGDGQALTRSNLSSELQNRFPHLADWQGWTLDTTASEAKSLLQGQLWLAEFDAEGTLVTATRVQTPGVLDDLYADQATTAELGARLTGSGTTRFDLWAPTAQSVSLVLNPGVNETVTSMSRDDASGVWSHTVDENLDREYYLYELTVYHPESDDLETLRVTDPYSLSLATNSQYSQVVDLDAADLQPPGWDTPVALPTYEPEDLSIYEMHIRDFSVNDSAGTAAHDGTYKAFTETARESVQHLQSLKDQGLTHAHLLPAFDIATINEDPAQRVDIDQPFSDLCDAVTQVATDYAEHCDDGQTVAEVLDSVLPEAEGGEVQSLNAHVRNIDSFNWGYDPFHYTVPEGSYATDAEGTQRILEFRDMVKALHDMGLMVVMDVVYNHTNAAGLQPKSVLDKVVPGYYHRRNPTSGAVETSTCCQNTASEHRMFEKLMIDSLKVWADQYRIDAFRFDLMGHHMKSNMTRALSEVRAVRDHVYFYGEGWDFGEVGQNKRGENASQTNMAGTGIGTFTDRLRDAVRGGGPFDNGDTIRKNQGFANAAVANDLNQADLDAFEAALLEDMDQIRLGLAGNLKTFRFIDRTGTEVAGTEVDYNGSPAGYADDPEDVINYVSKHDNQTLWDNNMYKVAGSINEADRARMQALALSIPMLGQGVPFIHMGSELLRSKSMARDSYDSGDWYNAVHFDGTDNNWNVGLPRENVDGENWALIESINADPQADPSTQSIALTADQFGEWLQIRNSSELFRLNTAEQVNDVVSFHNTGTGQTPGVIVMKLTDTADDLDASRNAIVVVFNATNSEQTMTVNGASGFNLHPVQQSSADTVVQGASVSGSDFTVPALTTAVFVN
ncbi:pullulanase-type alpha-1,6-glucosidase [Saccharospirillum salsuginis]|uniref:pullulanase n=1 Tax=Saccharospirillum salsuginis TaxID=418750 RepID=A0A918N8Y3_9GAMM|nr:pullulanase-type alpha-1,6-glucosidase [Saccharospirillum salsuginis]GGX49939.1 pullulanase [Saccharospirillum salsuginis]